MVWPLHTFAPNLLTHCVLDRLHFLRPQLYVSVPSAAASSVPGRGVARVPSVSANTAQPAVAAAAAAAAGGRTPQRVAGVEQLMALGVVALGHELQNRGLKAGGTLLQRAERLAAVGGVRAPAPRPDEASPSRRPPPPPRAAAKEQSKKRPRDAEDGAGAAAAPRPAAAPGSGGPALRAPDPDSRRSRAKAQGHDGGGWGSSLVMRGDWRCPGCGVNVFAAKPRCFKCGAQRPAEASGDGKQGKGAGPASLTGKKGKERAAAALAMSRQRGGA